MMISIRSEKTEDYDQIRTVTIDAFASSKFGHNGEAELIDALRAKADHYLSLVACSWEDTIVGHILFTPVVLKMPHRNTQGMGLAPLSVLSSHQKKGIGSSLIITGLQQLFEIDCPFVVVIGHPEYYQRFGFISASTLQIKHGFPGIPQNLLLIQSHPHHEITTLAGSTVHYQREFGSQYAQ